MDIITHVQDQELDNKAAIQLIKDMTQDNARREVEYQLDICGGIITYQDLLKHLSITFQGGDEEEYVIAEFYSCGQKSKEMEEAFADEFADTCTESHELKAQLPSGFGHDVEAAICKSTF